MSIKITTRNLFDKDRFIISDSFLKEDNTVVKNLHSNNWGISEYILINSNYVVLSGVLGLNPGFCLYDGNKNFIYGQKYDGNIETVSSDSIIVDTRGAKYIRVSVKRQNLDIFQLELGTEATPYIPHTIEVDRIVQNLIEITEIIQKTRNLTDTVVGERFSSATGNILKAANAVRTDLVPLEANKQYTVSGLDSGSSFIEILDSNKQPIARTGAKAWGTFTFEWDYTHFITLFKSEISDVGYIAACNYNLTDPNSVKLQIEAGTEATEYIPPMVKLFKAE